MLQNVFQCFFVTAERPKLGLTVIVLAGVTNMILDFLFIAVFGWGLAGAAFATVCGECVGGLLHWYILEGKMQARSGWERQNYTGIFLVKLVQMALQN